MGRRLAGSALDADRFLGLLLELAIKATGSEGGFVAVLDPEVGVLSVRTQSGMPAGFASEVDLSPEAGLFDWSLGAEGGALIMRDFDQALRLGLRSILAVPLLEDGEPLGIFALATFSGAAGADEHGLELLDTYARQATLMLHNTRLFSSFSDRYMDTVKGLARSLDARRSHLRGHHDRVAAAAVRIAREMGLASTEQEGLRIAGLIHDVGIAAFGDDETAVEANLEHPAVGASMVEHLPLDPAIRASIASHHEWFDGWGFPDGLRGEQIPLGGRVLGMAEFLIEMSTSGPVREAWDEQRLAGEIEHRRSSQFDPRVVDVTLALLGAGALELGAGGANTIEED
jgi:putative nucleotidyltransferase with HDIG domain